VQLDGRQFHGKNIHVASDSTFWTDSTNVLRQMVSTFDISVILVIIRMFPAERDNQSEPIRLSVKRRGEPCISNRTGATIEGISFFVWQPSCCW
jgi:hypothetical protein